MFADYQKAVFSDYQKKKAANQLSNKLLVPTPGGLRDECIRVFNERFRKKDEKILRSFFGRQEDETAYMKVISRTEADKFRPLNSFLKGETSEPEEQNIELLAWLIDFELRPYQYGQVYPIEEKQEDLKKGSKKPEISGAALKIGLSLIALAAVILIIFYLKPTPPITVRPLGKCMYWAGEHYKPGPCNLSHADTPTLQLDSFKLNNFKKITDWSKLNRSDIGKVFYAKIHNRVEIYNMDGFHPIDTNRGLHPLTNYMFNKYVQPLLK